MLTKEFFRTKNEFNTVFMNNNFNFVEPAFHLQSSNQLQRHNVKSGRYETETVFLLGSKIWNLSPEKYKEIDSLSVWKRKISNWETGNVPVDYVKHI